MELIETGVESKNRAEAMQKKTEKCTSHWEIYIDLLTYLIINWNVGLVESWSIL